MANNGQNKSHHTHTQTKCVQMHVKSLFSVRLKNLEYLIYLIYASHYSSIEITENEFVNSKTLNHFIHPTFWLIKPTIKVIGGQIS